MAIDEIQTGFWYPEVFLFKTLGLTPDMVVIGKGMTAGFHPLAGLIYRRELDTFKQYDAISTNGNATLAALVSLAGLDVLARNASRIRACAARLFGGLEELARDFPDRIEGVNGRGFLCGLRFRDRDDAISFHRAAVERGLWLRVHAYHEGHRTLLMKCPLVFDEALADAVPAILRELLRRGSGAGATARR
jgi:4-aminobutyrate aminotransferase-like enzyme